MHSTFPPAGFGQRPRVLIADDYAPIVTALQRMLSLDCEVVGQVADGTALLSETIRLRPDVLLLDLNLPNINCLQACSAIRQASPATKVIVLTGGFDPQLVPDLLRAGAVAFLGKNTAADELLAAIINAHRSG